MKHIVTLIVFVLLSITALAQPRCTSPLVQGTFAPGAVLVPEFLPCALDTLTLGTFNANPYATNIGTFPWSVSTMESGNGHSFLLMTTAAQGSIPPMNAPPQIVYQILFAFNQPLVGVTIMASPRTTATLVGGGVVLNAPQANTYYSASVVAPAGTVFCLTVTETGIPGTGSLFAANTLIKFN